ncbi:MAG: ribose-5-phosphate isomerase A, partial [Ktedonobacterales bacterium]
SDGGHYILDCAFPAEVMRDPAAIADKLKRVTGVVDHGLFIALTDRVYVGGADGVRVYNRQE